MKKPLIGTSQDFGPSICNIVGQPMGSRKRVVKGIGKPSIGSGRRIKPYSIVMSRAKLFQLTHVVVVVTESMALSMINILTYYEPNVE